MLFLAFGLVFSASLMTAQTADAACSYNGYYNSDGKCSSSFNYNFSNSYQERFQRPIYFGYNDEILLAMIERLQEMIRILEGRLDDGVTNSSVSVTTRNAISIEDDSATLRGRVYLGNNDEAKVYFQYGTSRINLNNETNHQFFDDSKDAYTFTKDIKNLDDDTVYYFRAVAEDENNRVDYGTILSLRTDSVESSLPFLETREVENITEDEAEIHGYVDMNDYDNGKVFFVYGEDESDVEDADDDYDRYVEIDERGDDLQKTSLDGDLDGSSHFQETITGLDANTRIYYSICVEFDDSDNDPQIMCGATESFRTDSN